MSDISTVFSQFPVENHPVHRVRKRKTKCTAREINCLHPLVEQSSKNPLIASSQIP